MLSGYVLTDLQPVFRPSQQLGSLESFARSSVLRTWCSCIGARALQYSLGRVHPISAASVPADQVAVEKALWLAPTPAKTRMCRQRTETGACFLWLEWDSSVISGQKGNSVLGASCLLPACHFSLGRIVNLKLCKSLVAGVR